MSQGGPASRHASRRSSRSPVDDDQISPSMRHGKHGGRDARGDLGGVPHTNGETRTQLVPPRTLGVHNILNPSEPHRLAQGVNVGLLSASRPPDIEIPTSTPGPFQAARPFHTSQAASISLPGTPVGAVTPLGGTSSERNSPTTAFPFPAINNPRRKLSPKPPRAMSLSHAQTSHHLDTRPPPLPSMSPAKRPYESDVSDEHRSQRRGLHPHLGMPQGPAGGIPNSERSLSQIPSPGPHSHPSGLPPSNPPGHQQPPPIPVQSQFPPGMQPGRSFLNTGPSSEGAAPWSEMMRRHGMGGAMAGAEGQQAFLALPGSDSPIHVEVDYSQASKKADEKRQRNAVASTRHRRKKKIMQEENTKQLQELRDERRQLEIKLEELTHQRDFYRDDRNRLRDIVSQTPGINHLAAGPSSPASARSSSYVERSPLMAASHAMPSQGYPGEPSPGERPAQRRRTDDRPDFPMPMYSTPGGVHPGASPGALPPMQAPSYGVPSRPTSAASSAGGERLPPLRSMEGPPPPTAGPTHVQEQDPRTGQWVSVQPRPQETGWATRRPGEGPTR
ncbi:hypothetical protein EDB81DRAFT_155767 [Dactylonectria macrodidyma]|uniref:BZIP domain-containing protein n=1 Tax=Dactylonectria macrodidyma TaxID=307937 RepID=A0A9P9JH08_9HYPO|nr:hypothetical protein EDB81DRAFT_155767 [Dactylonectria macrodidyma]